MKHLYQLSVLLAAITSMFTLSCCSDDDDPATTPDNCSQIIIQVKDADGTDLSSNTLELDEHVNTKTYYITVKGMRNGKECELKDYTVEASAKEYNSQKDAEWVTTYIEAPEQTGENAMQKITIATRANYEQPRKCTLTLNCKGLYSSFIGATITIEQDALKRDYTVYPVNMQFRTDNQYVCAGSGNKYICVNTYNGCSWNHTFRFIDIKDGSGKAYIYDESNNSYIKENYMNISTKEIYCSYYMNETYIRTSYFYVSSSWYKDLYGYLTFSSWNNNKSNSFVLKSTNLCRCNLGGSTDYSMARVIYQYGSDNSGLAEWTHNATYTVNNYMPTQKSPEKVSSVCEHYNEQSDGGSGNSGSSSGNGNSGSSSGSGNSGGGSKSYTVEKVSTYRVIVVSGSNSGSGYYGNHYKWTYSSSKIFLSKSGTDCGGGNLIGVASKNYDTSCKGVVLPKKYTYKVTDYSGVGTTSYYYFD